MLERQLVCCAETKAAAGLHKPSKFAVSTATFLGAHKCVTQHPEFQKLCTDKDVWKFN